MSKNTIPALAESTLLIIHVSKNTMSSDHFTYDLMRELLGDIYHPNMSVKDIFYICLKACVEVAEKRSSINMDFIQSLCFSPESLFIPPTGSNKLFPSSTDTITFDKLYTDYLVTMMNFLRLTSISDLPGYEDYRRLRDSQKKTFS